MRALALLPLLAGCTITPGQGFVHLADVSLDVGLVPGPARDLGDDTIVTDEGWDVQFHTLELRLDRLELQTLETGGGGGTFDPATPPPGYSLCHNGHCHHESGALVDYVDIQAELNGGGGFDAALTFPLEQTVDLLDGAALTLPVEQPELDAMDISRVLVVARGLRLEAVVDGGVSLDLDLDTAAQATSGFDFVVDRDQEPRVALNFIFQPDGTLLDGLDLSVELDPELQTGVQAALFNTPVHGAIVPLED